MSVRIRGTCNPRVVRCLQELHPAEAHLDVVSALGQGSCSVHEADLCVREVSREGNAPAREASGRRPRHVDAQSSPRVREGVPQEKP